MVVQSCEDLRVWQLSIQLVEMVYLLTDRFPKKEQYRLVDQMCRAAISIPSNIAEGSKRHTTREYIRFVGIARGSLAELEPQMLIARKLNYISQEEFISARALTDEIGKLLGGLSLALERKIEQNSSAPTLAPALT